MNQMYQVSQPHFEASVRMKLTLPKVGFWSPPGLLKTQVLIAGVKTPCIEVFFIPLERSWSVDVKMVSHKSFGHLQHKLWSKEGPGVKLAVWLPTTKSRESTRFRCVQVECDTPLECSWGEIQLCFRFHPDRRSKLGVMSSQSPESPNWNNFRTPPWESQDKKPFGCRSRGRMQRILYEGRWWLPSSPGPGELSGSVLHVVCPNTKVDPEWRLTNLWLVLM
jgi:hypothetical protein